jgi:putative transposase
MSNCAVSCPTTEDLQFQAALTSSLKSPISHALGTAINQVRRKYPFTIDAFVLLPDHFHCLWTLPQNDHDLSTRLRLIKTYVTRHYAVDLGLTLAISTSRTKRKEQNLWQRRFWNHVIRDETDFAQHCDYIHYNPVRHQLC